MNIGRKQIAAAIENRGVDQLWALLYGHTQMLLPFWTSCITNFSQLVNLNDDKRNKHLVSAQSAFLLMDDWRYERLKIVKARRKEIDSAISFIRNAAMQKPVSELRVAAAARNAAAALRPLLYTSCHSYGDDQIPDLIAETLFCIAAVRTRFPFDFGTLMCFHPGYADNASDKDLFVTTLEIAAQTTGRIHELHLLLNEVELLFTHIDYPRPIADQDWFSELDVANSQLHWASQKAFHSK
jgi:hypothetical protein